MESVAKIKSALLQQLANTNDEKVLNKCKLIFNPSPEGKEDRGAKYIELVRDIDNS